MDRVREGVDADHLDALMSLFANEWWTSRRTIADVQRMIAGSDLVFSAVDDSSGALIGFARVLTDWVYLASVLDVVVALEARERRVGSALMESVVTHPRLQDVRSVELVCQPDLIPFYRRFGFTDTVGQSRLMRRTADPTLIGT
jgi:predicted N-acetyltransferase YhbS